MNRAVRDFPSSSLNLACWILGNISWYLHRVFRSADERAYMINLKIKLSFDVMFDPLASGSRFQRLRYRV